MYDAGQEAGQGWEKSINIQVCSKFLRGNDPLSLEQEFVVETQDSISALPELVEGCYHWTARQAICDSVIRERTVWD